jgi:RimJ/RimL family protein N-acetyltransferase
MKPDFIIKGKRINLRTMILSDLDDYRRWDDPDIKAWAFDGPWYPQKTVPSERARKRYEKRLKPPYRCLEIETSNGVHIGFVIVHHREDDPHMTEFGIDIVEEEYWNKGLGSEAVSLWIRYLFIEFKFARIGFSTWSGNPRMIGVGRKLGFVQEACIRNGCKVNGKFYDRIKMGMLREEWQAKKPLF